MKKRTLGFGFLSLSIYLLGIYALSSAFLYLKSKPPYEFSIRLAFLDTKFDVLLGIQLLTSLYFLFSLVFLFNPKRNTVSSMTSIGFWALSSSSPKIRSFTLAKYSHLLYTVSESGYPAFPWFYYHNPS